jgi:hypothetical protein
MYIQRTASSAAGNGLHTTTKYMRGAAGIDLSTKIIHLRRTTSGATGNGLGATMKYLRRTMSAAANNGLSTTIAPRCSAASFEENSEPHTGARPSARLCGGGPSLLAVFISTLLRYTSAEQGRRRPTPRFIAAGAGGVATFETCVGAAA